MDDDDDEGDEDEVDNDDDNGLNVVAENQEITWQVFLYSFISMLSSPLIASIRMLLAGLSFTRVNPMRWTRKI
jgi:hypothetical protein